MRYALFIPNDGISNHPALGAAADDRVIEMRQQVSANRAVAAMRAARPKLGRKGARSEATPIEDQKRMWRRGRDFRLIPRRSR